MKTKEEIFTEVWNKNVKSSDGIYTSCIEAMQLYSDQQNKELREELAQEDEKAIYIERANTEIQHLKDELQEAKTSDGRGWKAVERLLRETEKLSKSVDSWVEISTRDQNEITRLREQYPIKLYGWEISPETEPNALKAGIKFKAVNDGDVKSGESVNELIEECAEETNDYFWRATDGFKAKIERLTKEVEELRGKVEKWVFSGIALHAKNIRLRELLGKAKQIIINGCVDPNPFLDSIDNALKP